jgi:hypothetical protein
MTATSIPLAALQETIACAIAKYPEQRGRIERAAQLIATGHVDQISADLWAVRSQANESVYIVDATGCPCVDARRHPGQSCKHVWSIDLLLVAQERARRLASRQSAVDGADTARIYLTQLIEERALRGRIVAAESGRAVDDERCRLLDEQIARLRANLAPISLREAVAA